MRRWPAVLISLILPAIAPAQTYSITTFAGGGFPSNTPGTSLGFRSPQSVTTDSEGNVFFADRAFVFRIDAASGIVTLVAGSGWVGFSGDNGPATSAQLNNPHGLAVDPAGNLYIADWVNNRIRKVSGGVITTVAGNGTAGFSGDGGPATSAQLNQPLGVAVDSVGDLYIADWQNNRIRKVSGGVITTVAGNGTPGFSGDGGPAIAAQLRAPTCVTVPASGGQVYFWDGNGIRTISGGIITSVGNTFGGAQGMALDLAGNLYLTDGGLVREFSGGVATIVAGRQPEGFSGDNGPATSAQLNYVSGVTVDTAGNIYIADSNNARVRKVSNGMITTVAGNGGLLNFAGDNGSALSAQLNGPGSVTLDSTGTVYIADTANNRIRSVKNGVITTIAGNGTAGFTGDFGPATSAELNGPLGVAVDTSGNIFVADSGNNRIRKISNGEISTIAGLENDTGFFGGDNGPATGAHLSAPSSVAVGSGGELYISDYGNGRIRKIAGGVITTVAGGGAAVSPGTGNGDNGPAIDTQLSGPVGIAIGPSGELYIADSGHNSIRKVSGGIITTVAGNGTRGFRGDNGTATDAELTFPSGVAVDSDGSLYIADQGSRIRKVADGVISTIAGTGVAGLSGDNGPALKAQLAPVGVAVDTVGNVYDADGSDRVRVLTPNVVPTIMTNGVAPIYSSIPVIQPGSWVSLYGANLTGATFIWSGDFPTSLGGVSVAINNKPAYLWYVSPGQINLQVPDDDTRGIVNATVTTAGGTATSTVTLGSVGPSFSLLDGRHVAGIILRSDGSGAYGSGAYDIIGPTGTSLGYATVAAKAGDVLEIFGVGFGPVSSKVPAGKAYSGSAATVNPISLSMGGVNVTPLFTGMTSAGLYQINLRVPSGLGPGDVTFQAAVSGGQTPSGAVLSLQ